MSFFEHDRAGVGAAPSAEQVRARLARLRGFRWSSYRAYAGAVTAPKWLEPDVVLEKGGGRKEERRQAYRQFVESQVKQGRMDSPWEELQDRVFLGGIDFIATVKKRARQVLKGETTPGWMRERVKIETIIGAVESGSRSMARIQRPLGDADLGLMLTLARKYAD